MCNMCERERTVHLSHAVENLEEQREEEEEDM